MEVIVENNKLSSSNCEVIVNEQDSTELDESQKTNEIHDLEDDIDLLPRPKQKISIEFNDIRDVVKYQSNDKEILKGCSGCFEAGNLIAVMGPSGAGKSSLLNILAGQKPSFTSGEILINKSPVDFKKFKKISAYIMQDDLLHKYLTVQESMMTSANLRMIEETASEKRSQVNNILKALGLSHIANTYVSKISGGQRKRLSIALELLSNPSVLFLDEPTSGLDSQSAYTCIALMKKLASYGRTIICTIHQPNAKIFALFTRCYIVSSGSCIYNGERSKILTYFNNLNLVCPRYHNIADYIIEVASGDTDVKVENLVSNWKKISGKQNTSKNLSSSMKDVSRQSKKNKSNLDRKKETNKSVQNMYQPNESCSNKIMNHGSSLSQDPESYGSLYKLKREMIQLNVLLYRCLISMIRDKLLTVLTSVASLFIGLLVGGLFFKIGNDGEMVVENIGCIFFMMVFIILLTLIPTVVSFPLEKMILFRENLNNWYSLGTYYIAKTIVDIPFVVFSPILFVVVVYFMTGQPFEAERFGIFLGISIATAFVGQSVGVLIGAVSPSPIIAVFLAPLVGLPAILYSGFLIKFTTMPNYMKWISYMSFTKYSWEAFLVTIYGNRTAPFKCSAATNNLNITVDCPFRGPSDVLDFYDISEKAFDIKDFSILFNFIILVSFLLILRSIAYIILKVIIWKRL